MTTRNPSNTPTQTKWTWFELVGLILAFGLIGWPVLNFAVGAVFPPNAQGEAASSFTLTTTASVSNAAPGEQYNYIFAIKANRTATLGRLTTVLPDQLNYVNSFCVPPNCDRVNNSEYNVDKHTLSYSGTSTAFQAGDSVTLVLVVQLSKNATGTVKSTAQICDTNQVCATSDAVNVTVGGSSSPTTVAATATPAPPTATSVPPTATDVPPTATAAPTPTVAPTATAVPPTATPAEPPTATPIAAPTPTPARATTPPNAIGDGQAGTPSSEQATVAAATATAEPTTAATTTAAPTAAPTTGVIGGSFTASAGASALSGNRVDLVLRGGGTEKVVASSTVDGTGKYSFLDVKPTGSGEVYYVKYTNTNASKTLRNWSTTSFAFSGGQVNAPSADLSDITVGQPGTAGTSFTLPLTLNWSKRAAGDVYSITVFRADGTGVALASGDLGNNAAYTLKNGTLPGGGYIAEINVTNASGSGVSQGQFIFKAGTVAAAATTSAAVVAPTTVAATPTATAVPTPTRVPVPAGDKGEVLPDSSNETAPATATVAPTVPAVATSVEETPVTDTPDLAPIANVISLGVLAFMNGLDTGTPAVLPPATNRLPQSGGELPVAGLLLAAGVLGWRRYRLVIRPKA
jgi:hypothetical protein